MITIGQFQNCPRMFEGPHASVLENKFGFVTNKKYMSTCFISNYNEHDEFARIIKKVYYIERSVVYYALLRLWSPTVCISLD